MPYMAEATTKLQPALAQFIGDNVPSLDGSLWSMFANTAAKYPSNDALVSCWQKPLNGSCFENLQVQDTEVLRWSYQSLHHRSEALAAWLQYQGCKRGMKLAVVMWNSAEWALFFWASAKLSMTFIPLDPRTPNSIILECIKSAQPHVLVLQESKMAPTFEDIAKGVAVRVCCSTPSAEGWHTLSDILSFISKDPSSFNEVEEPSPPNDAVALIVYTSGTTSTPKGCPHTSTNLVSQSYDFDPNQDASLIDRWLVHTPSSHIMTINNVVRAWRYGGACVFPSKTFDIAASFAALQAEKCTRMGAVPSIIEAMVSFSCKEPLSLQYISLGGTIITAQHVQKCQELGCPIAMPAFGMSEGVPITSWRRTDPLYHQSFYRGVGKILPGAKMRICAPTTKNVLNVQEPGELHISGTSVIKRYLDDRDAESFYTDEYGTWLMTGDAALIDDSGVLHITGRLKDLIIRGGENIAPATIECCLDGLPGITAQVIGVSDLVAGEIPVAVVRSLGSHTKADLIAKTRELGKMYALGAIFTLKELGIDSFPLTTSGKIRKEILKQKVVAHMAPATLAFQLNLTAIDPTKMQPYHEHLPPAVRLADQLRDIWTDLGNVKPEPNDPILEFADSITMLRYCDRVWKQLGKRIKLSDVFEHNSITEQAMFLTGKESHIAAGLPAFDDSWFTDHDPGKTDRITSAANKILKCFGLSGSNLEDVIPIRDSYHTLVNGPRKQSYRHRTLYRIKGRYVKDVKLALHKCLDAHPMFRTVLARMPDGTPFHVVARPSEEFYDHLISTQAVASSIALQAIYQDDLPASFSHDRMFKCRIITVDETRSMFLVLTYNHSIFDAVSMIRWTSDLDDLIVDLDAAITVPTAFRQFADAFHSYRESREAKSDVDYFVRRLRGISRFENALWPPKRTPGWMVGNDEQSLFSIERDEFKNQHHIKPSSFPRVVKSVGCPHLQIMKTKYQMQPSLIVKTAIALFNIQQTGQDYAIFNNLDSGRDWPFMLPWMKQHLPPAMTIDGPTMEWTMNMLRILPSETVGDVLKRLDEDQKELSHHSHAPWFSVLEKLADEGEIVRDASQRQCFNWDMSLKYILGQGNDFKALQPAGRLDWPDCGIMWGAGMLSESNICVAAVFDELQLSTVEVNCHVQSVLNIISKLTDPENWNVDVGRLLVKD